MEPPLLAPDEPVVEFTLRAALAGIVFGAANAGGFVRSLVEARRQEGAKEGDPGVLAASGMIAGEGLAGVAIAFLVAAKTKWPDPAWSRWLDAWHFAGKDFAWIDGLVWVILGIVLVLGVSALLYRAGRSGEKAG